VLKKRIIPIQLLNQGRLIKTVQFDRERDVGDPVSSSKIYSATYADELVFLNVERSQRNIDPLIRLIEKVSEVCFMPLSVGGGINSAQDAETLIRTGADKVVINSLCYRDKTALRRISEKFGKQAVVVSIDVRMGANGQDYGLFSDCGRRFERVGLEEHIAQCLDAGAGEILLNSIDRDGTMQGYDIPLVQRAMKVATVPLIACGGAGHYAHLKEAFLETGVPAVACGSLFNFGDNNPIRAKAFLSNYDLAFKRI
jgi:cyclase